MKTNKKMSAGLVIVLVIAIATAVYSKKEKSTTRVITNFAECKAAGYPIMESYPEQCRTKEGTLFVNEEQRVEEDGRVAGGYAVGRVTLSPLCPVESVENPCEPSQTTYTSRKVLVFAEDGVSLLESWSLDENGSFNIALSPGNYTLQISPAGIGPGEKKPVTIRPLETTTVNFDIDSGIR